MGFYGNITNMARTSFTFDKTYPNRQAMDAGAEQDEVFVGRYVLVDYDNNDFNFIFSYKWIDEETRETYFSQSFSSTSTAGAYRWTSLKENEIIIVPANKDGENKDYNQADPNATVNEYWKCTGVDSEGYNIFEPVVATKDSYTANYNIDTAQYGNGRGYDSTAWQKTVVNGKTKYVMVAELNSVVPSFGITADAPTMTPLRPHWGKDSTNVYYNLHWQVPWGMRIKGAHPDVTVPKIDDYGNVINGSVTTSKDEKEYPSDEYVTWQRVQSDPNTGETTTLYAKYSEQKNANKEVTGRTIEWVTNENEATLQPAAIYYNKAGLSPEIISYSSDKTYEGWGEEGIISDSVSLMPTGRSGYGYNDHDDLGQDYEKADSMELSVILPSLGDAMANIWDLIYGGKEANNQSKYRNMDVAWENARYYQNRYGLRLTPTVEESEKGGHLGYREDQVNTVAGALNSVHDLMGMIIVPETSQNLEANIDSLDDNRIYYDSERQDYYRRKTGYSFTKLEEAWENGDEFFNDNDPETGIPKGHEGLPYVFEEVDVTEDNFDPNVYYELVNGEYVPLNSDADYVQGKKYYGRKLKIASGSYREVDLEDWDAIKYWYQDYTGFSYGADDEIHQDYIQSKTYEFGRKYYKDLVAEVQEEISETPYEAGKYYYKDDNGSFILDTSSEPSRGRVYYKLRRQLTDDDKISTPIYVPNQYYYQDPQKPNEYKLATTISMPEGRNLFYRLDPEYGAEIINKKIYVRSFVYEPITLNSDTYTPGTYYVANKENPSSTNDNDYELDPLYVGDELNSYNPNKTYYVLNETLTATTDVSKALDLQHPFSVTPFIAGVFFRKVGNNYYSISQNDIDPKKTDYYVFWNALKDSHWTSEIELDGDSEYNWRNLLKNWYEKGILDTDPTANEGTNIYSYSDYAMQRQTDFFQKSTYHRQVLNDCGTEENPSYDYILENSSAPKDIPYTQITFEDEYSASTKYAYLDPTIEGWAKYTYTPESWDELVAAGRLYSYVEPTYAILKSVTPVREDIQFYYPYKYYEKVGDQYHLLVNEHIPTDNDELITTYEKFSYYVLEDKAGIHQHGEEWNPNIKYIPSTIQLGIRKEQHVLEGIAGFARDLSTIHGLILRLLKTLEPEDSETRDIKTIRGMLNTMNDMFTKIHDLQPKNAIYVNDYGQISSAPIETDKWIDVTINSRVKDPSIIINHHDIMPAAEPETTSEGNVNGNGDTINLYTPQLDEKGHVVGKHTEIVTLPYGYKTIKIANDDDTIEDAARTVMEDGWSADNTQDILTFSASNKWLKLDNKTKGTVKFGHLVQGIDTTNAIETDLNNNIDTIMIRDITQDEAGHIRSNKLHEYTLPYGYKTVIVGNENIVADNTQDDIEVIAGDAWVELAGSSEAHTITIAHANAQETAENTINVNESSQINENTGQIELQFGGHFGIPILQFDNKGHFCGADSNRIKLPILSLTDNDTGNIITGLNLVPELGAFMVSKTNAGSILLGTYTSYPVNLSLPAPDISGNDSISLAFSKLEANLKNEIDNRESAIETEIIARNTAISNAINGLTANDIPNISISQVTDLQTILNSLQPAGNYLTSTTEAGTYEVIDPITGTPSSSSVTYGQLFERIRELEVTKMNLLDRIVALENRVTVLEGGPQTTNYNVTLQYDSNIVALSSGSFSGGSTPSDTPITITFEYINPDNQPTVEDWEQDGVPLNNTTLTYTFTPTADTTIEIIFAE